MGPWSHLHPLWDEVRLRPNTSRGIGPGAGLSKLIQLPAFPEKRAQAMLVGGLRQRGIAKRLAHAKLVQWAARWRTPSTSRIQQRGQPPDRSQISLQFSESSDAPNHLDQSNPASAGITGFAGCFSIF